MGHWRPAAGAVTRTLGSISPASGAEVMGAGIVSIALSLAGQETISRILLVIDALTWVTLVMLLPARVIRGDARFRADVHTPTALTSVVGTAVLGTRLVILGWNTVGIALLVIAVVIWAALLVPVLSHWKTPTVGVSMLLAVSAEALAALAATLAASEHARWLLTVGGQSKSERHERGGSYSQSLDTRAGVRAGDPEIGEQRGDGFGGHGGASIGVHGVRGGPVAFDGLGDEVLRELGVFDRGDDPGGVEAGVDVDEHVQLVEDALVRAAELGFDLRRVGGLAAAFPGLPGVAGDAVHRRRRTQVGAGVELTGPDLADRQIRVGLGVDQCQHRLKCSRRGGHDISSAVQSPATGGRTVCR